MWWLGAGRTDVVGSEWGMRVLQGGKSLECDALVYVPRTVFDGVLVPDGARCHV